MTKDDKKIIETFEALSALEAERRNLDKQSASLKKQEDTLKALLSTLIPENTEKAGVTHKVTTRSSISYGKLYDHILSTYIPKTKQPEVLSLKDTFSTQTITHTFKGV